MIWTLLFILASCSTNSANQENDKIIGFCTLENGNYVDFLYIHKDYQRLGIASKLYLDIEREARRRGLNELKSEVSKTARPFFERVGFKLIEQQTIISQGVELTNFKMTKGLDLNPMVESS